ncbi:esterase-like activity of phytase family protein [Kamptonema sp. UHCC 0994]|uniref:esterase-like activity of phytase family protein n=1 Tax=Kamptonema sp. UHCC 0994 TaxID=3031329 RepID=UPI0023B919BC|nr:esterase-like activity of phytase family protein [Kamptonema sp. UHCC 0994]MDF0552106.1 esterase-like activity of phytase family protein [Kamptonema sp. UHCC 0994]
MRKAIKFTSFVYCLLIGFILIIVMGLPVLPLTIAGIDFIGEIAFSTGLEFQQTEVGGLSGITYDASKEVYYTISDDRSQKAPARFYTLKIDLTSGKLKPEGVKIIGVTTLLDEDGKPFAPLSLDSEGIAFTGESIFVSSEGDVERQINPFIKEFSVTGKLLKTLPIPDKFLPNAKGDGGIRNNLGLESLTVTPNRKYLFTATENALVQDGDVPTNQTGTTCRILRYNLASGQPEQEFVYITEPLVGESTPPGSFITNGLVDLVAIADNRLLSLERAFSQANGITIRIFDVSLEKADNIQGIDSLKSRLTQVSPAQKRLLLDLKDLNLGLDNLEGLAFGPLLADGKRSLVLVSDNNFNPLQLTQFLGFGINFQQTP